MIGELIFLKGVATGKNYYNLLKSINIANKLHDGQKRKTGDPYICHPARVASELWSLGVHDDIILSAALLHDVLEDCQVTGNELIHDDGIDEKVINIVKLLTKVKNEDTGFYYDNIKKSPEALLVKISDRVNNVSSMNNAFTLEKMKEYVKETEDYVIPLCKYGKTYYPEYADEIFVMKYHIDSINTTVKGFISIIENSKTQK